MSHHLEGGWYYIWSATLTPRICSKDATVWLTLQYDPSEEYKTTITIESFQLSAHGQLHFPLVFEVKT